MVLTARVRHMEYAAAATISKAATAGIIRKYFHMLPPESEGACLIGLELWDLPFVPLLRCIVEGAGEDCGVGEGYCFLLALGTAGKVPLLLAVGRAMI